MPHCNRCKKNTNWIHVSMIRFDWICLECKNKEIKKS